MLAGDGVFLWAPTALPQVWPSPVFQTLMASASSISVAEPAQLAAVSRVATVARWWVSWAPLKSSRLQNGVSTAECTMIRSRGCPPICVLSNSSSRHTSSSTSPFYKNCMETFCT